MEAHSKGLAGYRHCRFCGKCSSPELHPSPSPTALCHCGHSTFKLSTFAHHFCSCVLLTCGLAWLLVSFPTSAVSLSPCLPPSFFPCLSLSIPPSLLPCLPPSLPPFLSPSHPPSPLTLLLPLLPRLTLVLVIYSSCCYFLFLYPVSTV